MIMEGAVQPRSSGSRFDARTSPTADAIDMMGTPMSFGRNAEIYGEGEPATYLYKVVSGAVRIYKVLADGRRQIRAFCVPGDVFGIEDGDDHTSSAEAIGAAKIVVVKRSALAAQAARDSEVAHQLWLIASRELRRAQEHLMALVETAEERVMGFLLDMAKRQSDGDRIELPMSRQDIADYLGLTIETVSRTMTRLESIAVIELASSRSVVLRRRRPLGRLDA